MRVTCIHEILHLMYFIYIYFKLYIYITLYCTVYVFLTTRGIEISKLRDSCITVVGGMRIIKHVQQWLLNLRCVLAIAM